MYACLECGKRFKTTKAAERALNEGCPKCGGSDIDLAPVSSKVREMTADERRQEAEMESRMMHGE